MCSAAVARSLRTVSCGISKNRAMNDESVSSYKVFNTCFKTDLFCFAYQSNIVEETLWKSKPKTENMAYDIIYF